MSEVSPVVALDALETSRLGELEAVVERGLNTFVEVGRALMEIRDSRLYRQTHATFEDYCHERWGFTDRRARQLMTAAAIGTIVPVPNEGQARELAPLLRDEGEQAVVEAYRELRDEYGAEDVTAKKVRSLVKRRLDRKRRERAAAEDRARKQAQFINADGRKLKIEEYVTYSTPMAELADDYLRIIDGIDKTRAKTAEVLLRPAAEVFCRDWTPYFGLRDALRGARASTPDRKPASDLLQPVDRDLFERGDVTDALRAIDQAIDRERQEFLADFAEWLDDRAARIGDTLDPYLLRIVDIIEGLPETQLVAGGGFRGRYVEDDEAA